MDVTSTYTTSSLSGAGTGDVVQNPDGILGKDDFLKLLLIELQYQDPTDPMDTEKILTQTSELASLEASENTNKALQNLSESLESSMQFASVSAIGKMGSLGTDAVLLPESGETSFELYFPDPVSSGTVTISDRAGNTVRTFDFSSLPAGVSAFSWDGTNDGGERLAEGYYSVRASYVSSTGESGETAYGVYPIESVRFEGGKSYLKMGSSYYPLETVVEIYGG